MEWEDIMNHIMTMLRLINFSLISKSADFHLDLYRNLAPQIKQLLSKIFHFN